MVWFKETEEEDRDYREMEVLRERFRDDFDKLFADSGAMRELERSLLAPEITELLTQLDQHEPAPWELHAPTRQLCRAVLRLMRRIRSNESHEFWRFTARIVLLPRSPELFGAMLESIHARALRRVRAHPIASRLADWCLAVMNDHPYSVVNILTECNAAYLGEWEHFLDMGLRLKPLDYEEGEPGQVKAEAVLRTFGDLAEQRYRRYVWFIGRILHAAGLGVALERPTLGGTIGTVLPVLERYYPDFSLLIDPEVKYLRNAVQHLNIEHRGATGEVRVWNTSQVGVVNWNKRMTLAELEARLDSLWEVVGYDEGYVRALEYLRVSLTPEIISPLVDEIREAIASERHRMEAFVAGGGNPFLESPS